jgi:DNA-binding winged helix-turn-helix (wHTH) protein/tetratricopeptide (TPR) repeat protein
MKSFDRFRLDVANQSLWRGDVRVPLMPKPFAVLQYLVERAHRLVTQDQLLKAVWPETHVQPDVLRRYVMEIRRALGDRADAPRFIQTFPKRGFQFIAPVIDEPDVTTAVAGAATTLVGRTTPLTELHRHLATALGSRRQVVFVVGEPGIGKTSLVDAFQQQIAKNPELRVARGQCVEGFGSKEPYYPVLEALGQLIRGPSRPAFVDTLATHAPTWMIQFGSLVREEQWAALQREMVGATRERMVRELCEALEVITETVPIMFVLEDLHWADPSTLDLVSAIARRREPAKLLLLATFRPGDVIASDSPLKALSHDLTLHRLSHEVALDRLTETDVVEFLAPAFAGQLPPGFATVIHKHSDGNPLFMTAMLDHLEQQGALSRADGRWALTVRVEDVDPGVPETLKQMLEMQLEHLTDAERRLLECASVAGQHFTAWAVATMFVRDEALVEDKCQALAEGQQFLKLSGVRALAGGAPALEYAFKHALYREVLYRRLYPSERVNFHRRLAEGLEGLRTPVASELAAEIALHYEEGRVHDRAMRYLMLTAENASKRHAYQESIDVLEHARALLATVPETSTGVRLATQILERLGDAYYTLGDVEHSLEAYQTMAANAEASGAPAAEATALMRLAHPAAFVDSERCVAGCERAAQIAAAIGDQTLEMQARLLRSCWRIMIEGWRSDEAESCRQSFAALRARGADLAPYDEILYARVQIFGSAYADSCASAERALVRLTEPHALWIRAKALSTKANALLFGGRLGEAHTTVAAGIHLAKKNENAPWLGILLATLAWLHWEAFDFAGLEALRARIEQSGAAQSGPQLWRRATANVAGATMRILQGFVDLEAGDHDQAVQRFTEIRDQNARSRFGLAWQRRLLAQLGLSEAWLGRGNWTQAAAEADVLVHDAMECGDCYLRARALEMRARLALASGHVNEAERDVKRALDVVTAFDVPLVAWRAHATAWDVYRQIDANAAEQHRRRAEATARQLGDSLTGAESLRRSFFSAEPVRRLLQRELTVA